MTVNTINNVYKAKENKLGTGRKYANHWEWPNKLIKELGIVEDWIESMRLSQENIYHSPVNGLSSNQAPDCIVSDNNGNSVAIELCEFVCEEAVRRNQKEQMVYRNWKPQEILEHIEKILEKKDRVKYHGGPYNKVVVIIHTDEFVVLYNDYKELIGSKKFGSFQQVDEAFFIFSYEPEPSIGRCPYIKLNLSK